MPRFATLFSLYVMAAVGLPPFALFFAHVEILPQSSVTLSWGMVIALCSWFFASWYLFRMMQRAAFRAASLPICAMTDLRTGELSWLTIILVILLLHRAAPSGLMARITGRTDRHRTALEMMLWHK